ncbi:MAG: amidohydrolase family protein [Chloroflexota bacterium]
MSSVVNAHTHLEQSWLAEIRPGPEGLPFPTWIGRLIERGRALRASGLAEQTRWRAVERGIEALLAAGTTHMGDISPAGVSIEPLLDSGLAGVVYVELYGLDRQQWQPMFERARQLIEQYRPQERNGMCLGLTVHAPYSTHAEAFRAASAYCLREEVPLCIHAAESPYEHQALLEGKGPLYELYAGLSQRPLDPPGLTPIQYLESLGVLECRPLLIHVTQVSDEELDIIARTGCKVAHCPRSNQLLQCGRMPLEKMLARGIPVALGTDSLGSSPSLDVREEAEAAVQLHQGKIGAEVIHSLLGNYHVLL